MRISQLSHKPTRLGGARLDGLFPPSEGEAYKLSLRTIVYHIYRSFSHLLGVTRRTKNSVNKYMTLNGGSLGSWIDEERSKVR